MDGGWCPGHHRPSNLDLVIDLFAPRRGRAAGSSLADRIDAEGDCWEWMGARNGTGYGNIESRGAHRVIYEALVGPIPKGLDLDHLCRNPPCVNPDHLEPVTRSTNLLRGHVGRGRWPKKGI